MELEGRVLLMAATPDTASAPAAEAPTPIGDPPVPNASPTAPALATVAAAIPPADDGTPPAPDQFTTNDAPGQSSTFVVTNADGGTISSATSGNPFDYLNTSNDNTGIASAAEDGGFSSSFGGPITVINAGNGDDFVAATSDTPIASGVNVDLGEGSDILIGGEGDDTLAGGRGVDTLDGGGGTDRGFDFEGEPSQQAGVENFEAVDAADNTGFLDTSAAPLSEVSFQGVESVPARQQLLADTNQAFVDGDLQQTPVQDTSRDAIGANGDVDFSTELAISQEAFGISSPEGEVEETVSVAAHETAHPNQLATGTTPLSGTFYAEGEDVAGSAVTPSLEFDAIGAPIDTDGDGLAELDTAGRSGGQFGVTENDVREDLGIEPRPSFNGVTPAIG